MYTSQLNSFVSTQIAERLDTKAEKLKECGVQIISVADDLEEDAAKLRGTKTAPDPEGRYIYIYYIHVATRRNSCSIDHCTIECLHVLSHCIQAVYI